MVSHTPTQKRLLGVRFLIWIIVLGLVIVGTLFWAWFTYIDKEYFEKDIGVSDDVRANPYYAASKFMQRLHVTAQTQKNYDIFDQLPSARATILISSSRVGLSASRMQNMKDWIKSGGHLILTATEEFDQEINESRDKFFNELQLRVYSKPDKDKWDKTVNEYTFDGYEVPTKAQFYSEFYLEDASGKATFADGNNEYAQLIQYDYGEGMVTALASVAVFNNYKIDDQDHAMMLAQLVGDSDGIYFVYSQQQPGLTSLLAEYAPELVIAFIIALSIILLSLAVRQGPKLQDEQPVQREIRQHLDAAAEFSYQTDSGIAMSNDYLQYINQLMGRHVAGYSRLTPKKQIQKVAQKTNLTEQEIAIIWQTDAVESEALLDKAIMVQRIRKQL